MINKIIVHLQKLFYVINTKRHGSECTLRTTSGA
jgi:hypothetical protein